MQKIAVIAHQEKTLGGGLEELRDRLAAEGWHHPIWYEVDKSRKAPKRLAKALKQGAELVLVWGGDGMVQRCADTLAGTGTPIGILPAGTANLLAGNLGIPDDLEAALKIALHGRHRRIDLGRMNKEHFAVMAGVGFDAAMIADADRSLKDRIGRLAYIWTGMRHLDDNAVDIRVDVDGEKWYKGPATCVLLGNVGTITGGVKVFDRAEPDDGMLNIGVATAENAMQWARTMARVAVDRSEASPFVQVTRGQRIDVKFAKPMIYELDGGERGKATKKLKAKVVPGGLTVATGDPAQQ
jgi:diacylglycerol kinase (ATP)